MSTTPYLDLASRMDRIGVYFAGLKGYIEKDNIKQITLTHIAQNAENHYLNHNIIWQRKIAKDLLLVQFSNHLIG